MAPRLKVFVISDGLTDFAVAASSRTKALAAWGVRQDVFKEGQAHETDDPELVAAATARPGEVVRRPAASRGELAKLKSGKPESAKLTLGRPRPPNPKSPRLEPPPKSEGPSKAARKKIADLEAALVTLDRAHQRALAKLARERDALERRAARLEGEQAERRRKLETALSAARRAPG